ncbi:MAG: tyrosine-type recombinase/integrase [Coleofasciculus sp. C3-bin4]|nr:tyrosine-type recombinase/integrase [Coleofasciculus sp. C3-bin4]
MAPLSVNGRPLDRIGVFRIFKAAAQRAGIQGNVSPQWLRHAQASHSLDRGSPLHLTQRTLGHSRMGTIERYLHVRPNDSSAMYLLELRDEGFWESYTIGSLDLLVS